MLCIKYIKKLISYYDNLVETFKLLSYIYKIIIENVIDFDLCLQNNY